MDPETQGLHVFNVSAKIDQDTHVLFVDTEGISAVSGNPDNDVVILSMAMLYVIYSSSAWITLCSAGRH